MKKIVLIGPYPPPVGGVSIHIQRLINMLGDDAIIKVIDESKEKKSWPFNLRSFNLYRYFRIISESDIVHIHSGKLILRFFHVFICRIVLRKYTVVTIHFNLEQGFPMRLTKYLLSICNHAILVNEEGFAMMKTPSSCKYHLLPAFLPPVISKEPELPKEVLQWLMKKKSQGDIICVSNAGCLCIYNNQDLYGLDLCIEALKKLDKKICILFVIADNKPFNSLIEQYKQRIKNYGLNDRFLLWENSLSFVRLIKESHIVIRATNTDGDALTIREALFFNKKVVTSDVVKRPEGVFLFRNRDVQGLVDSVRSAIDNPTPQGEKINYVSTYKEIYGI